MTPTDSDQMVDVVNDITADWESLIRTYVPRIGSIPMCQGITWSPSWKAVPSRGRNVTFKLRKDFFSIASCLSLTLLPVPLLRLVKVRSSSLGWVLSHFMLSSLWHGTVPLLLFTASPHLAEDSCFE